MTRPWLRKLFAALVAPVLAASILVAAGGRPAAASGGGWTGTWATALTAPSEFFPPTGFDDQTVRMIVQTTSVSGSQVRIRLSNAQGEGDLRIGAATVARPAATSSPDLHPHTPRELSFGGDRSVTIPEGAEVVSDPVAMPVRPQQQLAVSLYLPEPTGPVPFHLYARQRAFVYEGDHTGESTGGGYTDAPEHFYILAGVEVRNPFTGGAVVLYGDSITDSFGASTDTNTRVSDFLARRLARETSPFGRPGVLNLALSGNAASHDHDEADLPPVTGRNGVDRLEEHVYPQPGVRTVIVALGLGDILQLDPPADKIIAALREISSALHQRGIRVLLATLTPAAADEQWTLEREATRQAVNAYIRTTDDADGVVDADRAVRDPANPTFVHPAYATEDGVHTNDLGNRQWAEAVPLGLL